MRLSVILLAAMSAISLTGCTGSYEPTTAGRETVSVKTPDGTMLELELADSMSERRQGLSGRDQIGADGMLFIFEGQGVRSIWMKDMRIALDILWLDSGAIVYMEQNVQPEPGVPDSQLSILEPAVHADAVLELDGGRVAALGLGLGDQLAINGLR